MARRAATSQQRASNAPLRQRAELHRLRFSLARILFGLGAACLLVGFVANAPWVLVSGALLFGAALFAHISIIAKLRPGNWYYLESSLFAAMMRPRYGENGRWVFIPPWHQLNPDPFWVDTTLALEMSSVKDLMTEDDLPFALKGKMLLRFYPDRAERDFLRLVINQKNMTELVLDHVRIEIAHFVNDALLNAAEAVHTPAEMERYVRSPDFKQSIQEMIRLLFSPPESLAGQQMIPDYAGRMIKKYGVALATMYVIGGYGDALNKTRQNIAGATQGARLARQVQETEDITLEEITLAASATRGYFKLRGYVPMNSSRHRQNPAQQRATPQPAPESQTAASARPDMRHDPPAAPQASPHEAPAIPQTSQEVKEADDLAERIERLTSPLSAADILKARRAKRKHDDPD